MADYAENICQAVDEILKVRLAQMSYDTTVKCSIVDDNFACIGKYLVNNGSASFYAYTHLTNLKKNDTVYVLVPNHDYDEQKFIIGSINAAAAKDAAGRDKDSLVISRYGDNQSLTLNEYEWNNAQPLRITWTRVINDTVTEVLAPSIPLSLMDQIDFAVVRRVAGSNYDYNANEVYSYHAATDEGAIMGTIFVSFPPDAAQVAYKIIIYDKNKEPLESNELVFINPRQYTGSAVTPLSTREYTQEECLAWVAKKMKEEKEVQG